MSCRKPISNPTRMERTPKKKAEPNATMVMHNRAIGKDGIMVLKMWTRITGTRAAQARLTAVIGKVSVRAHGASTTPDRHGQHGRKHSGRLRTQVGQRSQIRIKKLIHEIEIAFSGRKRYLMWQHLWRKQRRTWESEMQKKNGSYRRSVGIVVARRSPCGSQVCTTVALSKWWQTDVEEVHQETIG